MNLIIHPIKIIKLIYGFLFDSFIFRKHVSINQYLKFYKYKFFKKIEISKACKALKLKNYDYPFFYRPGSSDILVIRDFFLKSDYVKTIPGAQRIIDAGANIGAATVLFKKRYPNAEIIAIEPDKENCNIFNKNTSHYKDVELLMGGLASTHGKHLQISDSNVPSYSYQLQYSDTGLPSYSINGLRKNKGWDTIDIVKIDIEGGEKELFSKNIEWMKVTKQIIIELHDYKIEGCS